MIKFACTLLALCMAMATRAQQIDTAQLYGKWQLMSMDMKNVQISRDSFDLSMHKLYRAVIGEQPDLEKMGVDSSMILHNISEPFRLLFQCTSLFNTDGTGQMQCKDGAIPTDTTTYNFIWLNEEVILLSDGTNESTMELLELTADTLAYYVRDETDKTKMVYRKLKE